MPPPPLVLFFSPFALSLYFFPFGLFVYLLFYARREGGGWLCDGTRVSVRSFALRSSVNLDAGVDCPHEDQRRDKADRARHDEHGRRHARHGLEEDERRQVRLQRQHRLVVVNAVQEDPESHPSGDNDAPPPPPVVLEHEHEVHDDERDLRGSEQDGERADGQEAEDVVHHALPHAQEDEAQLDEGGAERDQPGDNQEDRQLEVPTLGRHLARELRELRHGVDAQPPKPEPCAQDHERERDAEPQSHHLNDLEDRCRVRALPGRVDVQLHEDPQREQHAGVQEPADEHELPPLVVEHVQAHARDHAVGDRHQNEEEDRRRDEPAAVRGREEAEVREEQRQDEHADQLRACPDDHGEQARVRRRTEHVGVHQLPAHLLGLLVGALRVVVAVEVHVQRAEEDHRHNGRQAQHDQKRVKDAVPVPPRLPADVGDGRRKVLVPAVGPGEVLGHAPLHAVRPVHNLARRFLRGQRGVRLRGVEVGAARLDARLLPVDRLRCNADAHNDVLALLVLVDGDLEQKVVVDVVVRARALLGHADGPPPRRGVPAVSHLLPAEKVVHAAVHNGQVVDDEVSAVAVLDAVVERRHVRGGQRHLSGVRCVAGTLHRAALLVLHHRDTPRGLLDVLAPEDLAVVGLGDRRLGCLV
eukprot:Rhum_TRINITY_DN13446_c1_g1::Rhum_TRINITY_DN13446_c1_g1_i1::g.60475::m.60475